MLVKKGRARTFFVLVSVGLLGMAFVFSITKGAVDISLKTVWNALFHFESTQPHHLIVRDMRLPRVSAGALVGAALAVAGAVMQGVTRNPLADSGLMGLSAGAGFALCVCFAFFPELSYRHIVMFSFLGAGAGAALVNAVAFLRRGGASPMRLILAGVAVSSLLAALSQGLALYFNVAQSIMFWTVGGVANSTWEQIRIILPWISGALLGAVVLSPAISLLSLGEDTAKGLGLNTAAVHTLCSLIVLILAGVSVSVVGAVSFVGLIIPHIARFLVGVDYRRLIPSSAVLGALLVVLADLGARTLNPPFETPVGAVIALIGVPFFLYLAHRQKKAV
jgi:iron complex transport system permease protein